MIRKMSVCFSTRSSLRGRQRKEREKGGKMSLFSLKKTLSFSLSLSLFLFLSSICYVLAVDSFFFSSLFCTSFPTLGERSSVLVFSLSFFPSRGDRKPHHPFVSLSLSLTKRAFWKTRSPSRTLRGTQKERGMIISEEKEERSTPPI